VYSFGGGSKIAVFTWQGCLLELRGKTEAAYVARETPMIIYLNTHAGLEQVNLCTLK
jgi:polyribonucleotide 5'-hydroxyl-kinase